MRFFKSEKRGLPNISLIYLSIGLVILGLVAINIVVNLIWLSPFSKKLENRAINQEMSEARRAAENIEKSITIELDNIVRLSQDITKTEDLNFFINRFLKEEPNIKEISVINLKGQEEKRYSRERYFTGENLRDLSFLEEFEKAKNGQIFISKVDFTKEGEPYIKIAAPIRKSETEATEGVLEAVFYLKGTWGKVLEIKIGETGRVSVIDDKGMLIADPWSSRVLKKINLLDLPPTKPLIIGEIFKGAKYLNEKKTEVIGVGIPIKSLRWGVIVEQDVAEIEVLAKEARNFALVFLIAGLLIIGLLVLLVLVMRRADRDLVWQRFDLKVKTEELEEAKSVLEIKVQARTKELEELAQDLEEKVKQRTKELQKRIDELERFHRLTVGRELKMLDLKKEIRKLRSLEKY